MHGLSFIDILVWAVLLGFMVKGFMKGLVREVCSLLGLLMGFWAAFKYYPSLAVASRPYIHLPSHVASVVVFILILLTVGLLFFFLGHLLTVLFKVAMLGGVNRAGGIVFGLLQGGLLLSLLLFFGTSRPMPEALRNKLISSRSAQPFILCGKEIAAGWDGAVRLPPQKPANPAPSR